MPVISLITNNSRTVLCSTLLGAHLAFFSPATKAQVSTSDQIRSACLTAVNHQQEKDSSVNWPVACQCVATVQSKNLTEKEQKILIDYYTNPTATEGKIDVALSDKIFLEGLRCRDKHRKKK